MRVPNLRSCCQKSPPVVCSCLLIPIHNAHNRKPSHSLKFIPRSSCMYFQGYSLSKQRATAMKPISCQGWIWTEHCPKKSSDSTPQIGISKKRLSSKARQFLTTFMGRVGLCHRRSFEERYNHRSIIVPCLRGLLEDKFLFVWLSHPLGKENNAGMTSAALTYKLPHLVSHPWTCTRRIIKLPILSWQTAFQQ